jgi:hypothetical protein
MRIPASEGALVHLAKVLNVLDIMTPVHQLMRADTIENARKLFHEYDIVPLPRSGEITGYFSRSDENEHLLSIVCLISDHTGLFDMPKLLKRNPFYFVVSGNEISGYVHYSDLNKSSMKVPFFILFQAVEKALWDQIKGRVSDTDLKAVFTKEQVERFSSRRRKALEGNVDVDWTGIFDFPHILKLARYFGLNHLTDEEIDLMRRVRDKVAHSDNNLVSNYDDVAKLVQAYDLFNSLLEQRQ